MQEAHGMSGAQASARLLEMVSQETYTEAHDDFSEWLPLGVWEKRGFDPTAISTHAKETDKKADKMFGTLYRVRVAKESSTMAKSTTKRDTLACRAPTASQGAVANEVASSSAGPVSMLAITDKGSSDSSDDSSTSSSSAKKSKKKKSKKNKKKKSKKDKKKDKKRKHGEDDEDPTVSQWRSCPR